MIVLHQYPAIWGLPSLSPFCIKAEIFLKEHQLPYRIVTELNPSRGPKGKMPFIVDGTATIPDSSQIILYLTEKYRLRAYEGFEPIDIAHAQAFQRLVEEHLYFILLYARWLEPASWNIVQREFAKLFPPLIGRPFMAFIRSNLRKQAIAQGIGRHSPQEIYAFARQDLSALSSFLGGKPFFLGETWTPIDATVAAFLMTIFMQPVGTELKAVAGDFKNLVAYEQRARRAYFD